MKHLFSIVLILVTIQLSAQDTIKADKKYPFDDDPWVITALVDSFPKDKKLIAINLKEAVVYVKVQAVIEGLKSKIKYENYYKKETMEWINDLQLLSKEDDTIQIPDSWFIERIISKQLQCGDAMVFDKRTHLFAKEIIHKCIRVISIADRHFRFIDNRNFFRSAEWSGILPNEYMDIE